MVTRLGFALSTALDPGILLLDEGIGAGDARFAERAAKRLNDFMGRSSIIVLASHAAALLKSLCNKGVMMEAGRIVAMGPVDEVFARYRESVHGTAPVPVAVPVPAFATELAAEPSPGMQEMIRSDWSRPEFTPLTPIANQFAQCLGGHVETLDGAVCGRPTIHLPFRVCLRYRLLKDSPFTIIPNFHFLDWKDDHVLVSSPSESAPTGQGDYVASCVIDPFVFNSGRYSVMLALSSMELAEPVHFLAEGLRFEVIEPRGVDPRRHGYEHDLPGVVRTRLAWQVTKAP